MITVEYDPMFKVHYKTLTKREQTQTMKKIAIFSNNPFHPSLRIKKIAGNHRLFECSVNMDIQIIWCYKCHCAVLMDIGYHNILDNY